jgi:ribulose-5-phosphate 4-epimerase/fuculose-1-phosphate aldolase
MGAEPTGVTPRFATGSSADWDLRVDLAAAFRLTAEFDWHESVGNHFSASVSAAQARLRRF